MRRAVFAMLVISVLISACTSPHPRSRVTVASTPPSSLNVTPDPTPATDATRSRSMQASSVPAPATAKPSTSAAPTVPSVPAITFPAGSGLVIVLNPGHNGGNSSHSAEINRQVPAGFGQYKACDTTGTNTDAGYPEHVFNWDVALRVRAILQAHGVRVILTRPDDQGVGPCVDQRAVIGNAPGVAATISIHSDGAPADDHGFHVCYASRPPAGAAVDAQSRRLSTALHDALLGGSGFVPAAYIGDGNGYFARSDLAGLNLARGPATFLEIGNMRNPADAAVESLSSGRSRIAGAVAAGILAYLGR